MNELIKLVIEYKKSKSDFIFEDIVKKLKYIIESRVRKVPKQCDDDFYQELLECLITVLNKFKINNDNQISVDYFKKENLKILKKNNFKNVNKVLKNNYISGFIRKYGKDLLIMAFKDEDKYYLFNEELQLFHNENQFIKYLIVSLDRSVKGFYRSMNKLKDFKCISLNVNIEDDIELLDLISYTEEDEKNKFYDKSLLLQKDLEFINLFYEGNKILKQKEVGMKLNLSQQAVSKRLKKIKSRYKKAFENRYREVKM